METSKNNKDEEWPQIRCLETIFFLNSWFQRVDFRRGCGEESWTVWATVGLGKREGEGQEKEWEERGLVTFRRSVFPVYHRFLSFSSGESWELKCGALKTIKLAKRTFETLDLYQVLSGRSVAVEPLSITSHQPTSGDWRAHRPQRKTSGLVDAKKEACWRGARCAVSIWTVTILV